jgi:hypothetical protein
MIEQDEGEVISANENYEYIVKTMKIGRDYVIVVSRRTEDQIVEDFRVDLPDDLEHALSSHIDVCQMLDVLPTKDKEDD